MAQIFAVILLKVAQVHFSIHIAKQVRQDKQLAMTFPFAVFCHYSEQFFVSQAEQFSDGLSGQKQVVLNTI